MVSNARVSSETGLAGDSDPHVVARLKSEIARAKSLGFRVRMELFEDEQANWCEIGGQRYLFVDLSQTAAEQLKQIQQVLDEFLRDAAADPPETSSRAA